MQILSLLARSGEPLTVGAITGAVDVGQSTVSAHLKVLAGVGFVRPPARPWRDTVLIERRSAIAGAG